MKTAHLLFGLATACGTAPAKPAYPLCDGAGAPACGNIGQAGRVDQPQLAPPATQVVAPAAIAPAPATIAPAPATTQVLLGASARDTGAAGQPLVNREREVVCANVMGKGGSRRVCTRPDGTMYQLPRDGE
jgi:hypothetical protein